MGTDDRYPDKDGWRPRYSAAWEADVKTILITGAGGGIGGICGGSLRASASLLARGNELEDGGTQCCRVLAWPGVIDEPLRVSTSCGTTSPPRTGP